MTNHSSKWTKQVDPKMKGDHPNVASVCRHHSCPLYRTVNMHNIPALHTYSFQFSTFWGLPTVFMNVYVQSWSMTPSSLKPCSLTQDHFNYDCFEGPVQVIWLVCYADDELNRQLMALWCPSAIYFQSNPIGNSFVGLGPGYDEFLADYKPILACIIVFATGQIAHICQVIINHDTPGLK
jgi:hypothetical protein